MTTLSDLMADGVEDVVLGYLPRIGGHLNLMYIDFRMKMDVSRGTVHRGKHRTREERKHTIFYLLEIELPIIIRPFRVETKHLTILNATSP